MKCLRVEVAQFFASQVGGGIAQPLGVLMCSNSRSLAIWRFNLVRAIRLSECVVEVRQLRQREFRQLANMTVCLRAHTAGYIFSRFMMGFRPTDERARGKCYLII